MPTAIDTKKGPLDIKTPLAMLPGGVGQDQEAAIRLGLIWLPYREVIDSVFGLVTAVSPSVGKPLAIFTLILLRLSFRDFASLPEPLRGPESPDRVHHILFNAGGRPA
ncbi:MAG: hypothetical protein PVJ53_17020 [Desulfobacterales bacterium]